MRHTRLAIMRADATGAPLMSDRKTGPRNPLLALAAVSLGTCALAASTWHVFGHTWDEPEHIAAGLALIDHGHYDYDIQHPPLARLALAVGPYLAGARSQGKPPPDGKPEGLAVLYGSGHYELYLTLARAGALPFLALLVLVTYAWARRVLGPWESVLAAGLLATTPAVIGHGALATLDVPAAATCLLALLALQRWLDARTVGRALALGLAAGLAIGSKLSALPFLGLGGFALAACGRHPTRAGPRAPPTATTRQLLLAAVVAGALLALAYGGRIIYLTDATQRYNPALGYLFGYAGPVHDAAYALAARLPVPEAFQLIVGGIEALSYHNHTGHLSYLLGEMRTSGWWYFYIVALAAKTPLPLLALGITGLALLARDGWRGQPQRLALPALFVVLLGFVSAFSRINIGVRHVLVLYPLLAIGAALALRRAWHALTAMRAGALTYAGTAGLSALMVWQLVTVARCWPDYLPYFNELIAAPRAVLVDSDLDWGQDLKRLSRRLHELGVPALSLAYQGTADLARESLPPFVRLAPDQRATGWIAITELARVRAPRRFDWLDAYTPRATVGRTIELYYIPLETR